MIEKNKLSNYGKIFQEYKGKGKLILKNGINLNCSFSIAQFIDSDIYVICNIVKKDVGKTLELDEAKLNGKTKDGKSITAVDLRCIKNNSHFSSDNRFQQMIFRGSEFAVENESLIDNKVLFQFFLTNLNLDSQKICFELDSYKIIVSPVQNYSEIIKNIKAQKVDITYEAKVDGSFSEREKLTEIIDRLCLLLTLAQGCFINWISYKVNDLNRFEINSIYRNVVTKPYGTLRLISHKSPKVIEEFVKETYPNLHSCEQNWELRKAIYAYNDAKIESDFLEFRALKMAIVLEHLKGHYLIRRNNLFLIDEEEFTKIVPYLKNLIKTTLQTIFLPKLSQEKLEMIVNHAQAFNWFPFRRAISDLCKDIKLEINGKDKGRFVNIRNDLVHRMSFNSNLGSEWEQYTFLMTFIGKILLAILGYKGKYYDWTDTQNIIEKDLEILVEPKGVRPIRKD